MITGIYHNFTNEEKVSITVDGIRAARKIFATLTRLDAPVVIWRWDTLDSGKVAIEYSIDRI